MPVVSSDLKLKYSTKVGAAGNSNAGTAAASLGKYISTTEITSGVLNNLFDDISGIENAASDDEYRCVFIHNNHATITWENVKAYIQSETAGGASVSIGADPTAASAIGSAGAQAVEIADEDTPPVGVVFTAPTTTGTAILLGNIAPGQCKALWVKRLAADSDATDNDGAVLRIFGESI